MSYFKFERAGQRTGTHTKTGENIISYIVWVVQTLTYCNESLLIEPRKASKTFHSILSLLLMNGLRQIKKLWTHRALYMYSTKDLRSLPKPRSLFEMRSNQSVAFVEGAMKGEEKRGVRKGKWTPPPTIFLTKPIRLIVNTWPTQVRGAPLHGEFTLFIWNCQVEKLFSKWYHNWVKRTILLLYVAQQTRQMKWTKRFGPASSNSQVASWLAQFSSSKAYRIQYWIIHDGRMTT